ncbi:hypothetical protein P4O66_014183 [Electrophorus voltai]|uniref:Cytochrome c oxidase assembly factor 6 n=2 Tax=Electrophorus TaxID=8004 RepID=A0A4W4H3I5_ELEEL|nr:cytochrome c oxidase assembly factor 6 homolog [Electrophorus electricus]KAK1790268.1 hypothetical protein P4O66_014183 [Electrophorus voltai]
MSAPSSQQRRACWGAKDELWKCLDSHEDDGTACEKYRSQFEALCPAQWVKYFDKRRDFLKYKEKVEGGGAEPAARAAKV